MSKPDIVDRLRSVDSQGIRGIAERVSELLLCRGAADEIVRLREDNEVLLGESQRLHWDSKRLLGLLRECQDYVEAGMSATDQDLCDRIEREVGDESNRR